MATIENLFVSKIYRSEFQGVAAKRLVGDLEAACNSVREDD